MGMDIYPSLFLWSSISWKEGSVARWEEMGNFVFGFQFESFSEVLLQESVNQYSIAFLLVFNISIMFD